MDKYGFLPPPYNHRVLPFEKNIADYLRSIDIIQARELAIDIRLIRCDSKRMEHIRTLYRNLSIWAGNGNVCRDKRLKYIKTRYGGVKGNKLYTARFFGDFKVVIVEEDESINNIAFLRLRKDEKEEYKGNKDEDTYNSTPSLLQIAYGLMRKYENIELSIYGNIPGVIEPTAEQLELYSYAL